jgi:ribosomal protein S18 acetylase RimI-like enzyme
MIIQRAARQDAAEILDLQKRAYRSEAILYGLETIPPLTQTLDEMQADITNQVVLKALIDGQIIGSVRATVQDDTCHIGRLIVDPSWQNRGIGTRLMGEIEARFARVARFELFTGHKSARNLYLYGKLGYVPFRHKQVNDALTIIYLEKQAQTA